MLVVFTLKVSRIHVVVLFVKVVGLRCICKCMPTDQLNYQSVKLWTYARNICSWLSEKIIVGGFTFVVFQGPPKIFSGITVGDSYFLPCPHVMVHCDCIMYDFGAAFYSGSKFSFG
jgi:hypothetical protein